MKYAIVKGTQYLDSLWNMKKHFYTPSIHNIILHGYRISIDFMDNQSLLENLIDNL